MRVADLPCLAGAKLQLANGRFSGKTREVHAEQRQDLGNVGYSRPREHYEDVSRSYMLYMIFSHAMTVQGFAAAVASLALFDTIC